MNSQLDSTIGRATFEGSRDAILVVRAGEGRIVRANPSAGRLCGSESDELIGKTLAEIFVGSHAGSEEALLQGCREPSAFLERDGYYLRGAGVSRPVRIDITCLEVDSEPLALLMILDRSDEQRIRARDTLHREILERIARRHPLQGILESIVRLVEQESPDAMCSILLLDVTGRRLRLGAAPHLPEAYNRAVDGLEIGPSVGSCGTAAFTGRRVIVEDVLNHPLWAPYRELAARMNLRSCWSEPIRSSDGQVIGTFAVYHHYPTAPKNTELDVVALSTYLAGIAIENERTQQAVQLNEARISAIARTMPQALYVFDLVGKSTVYQNAELARCVGYSESELNRMGPGFLAQIVHPEDLVRMPDLLRRWDTVKDGEVLETEYRVRHASGDYRWFIGRDTVHQRDDAGRVTQIIGTAADITDRKLAAEALAVSERMLRTVLDNIPQGVFWKDRESRFLGCNAIVAQAFGYNDPSELIGKTDDDLHGVTGNQAAQFRSFDRHVMETAVPARGVIETATFADGTLRWLETNKYPLLGESGAVVGVLGTWHDITESKRAEALLQESEKRYRMLFERNLAGIIVTNVGGDLLEANETFVRMLGYDSRSEMIQTSVRELYWDPKDREQFIRDLLQHRVVKDREVRFRHRNGRPVWILAHNSLVDVDGSSTIFGTVLDITERKRMEEALRESENRYRNLIETTHDLIWSVDTEGRWTYLNRDGALAVYGREPEQLLGRPFMEVVGEEQLQKDLVVFERIKRGETVTHYQTEHIRPDGRTVILSFNAIPLRRPDGTVYGTTGTAVDITDRFRAEEEKRRATDDLAAALRAFPDLYFWTDLDGTIRRYEAGMKTYVPPENFLNRRFRDVLPPQVARQIHDAIKLAIATKVITSTEYDLTADGETKWFEARFVVLPDGKQVLTAVRDVSERRLAQEERRKLELQLQHTQKLESLGVMAGGIAHDFNNLLTGILGYSDLALQELPGGSPAVPLIGEAVNGARRAAELTKQMLAYSGKGRFVVEPISLSVLTDEMSRLLQISVTKNCVLSFHLDPDLPAVEGDVAQLRQVVMNLVINGSEAIGDRSGYVVVSTGLVHADRRYLSETFLDDHLSEGQYVFFEVADDGCGMSSETLAKIFDPFFTTKFTGRGLGLSAVLGIVRGHKGALKCTSEVGRGTSFRVLLPVSHRPPTRTSPNKKDSDSWRGSGTVLLVDDEETVRGLGRRMLERMGFQVETAADGQEAVALFEQNPDRYRLVVLDLTMPHCDGGRAFQEMRVIRPNVTAVLTSGFSEEVISERFAGSGLAGFVQKPFSFDQLRSIIRKIVTSPPSTAKPS